MFGVRTLLQWAVCRILVVVLLVAFAELQRMLVLLAVVLLFETIQKCPAPFYLFLITTRRVHWHFTVSAVIAVCRV